jgi:hypothetical protein
MSLPQPQADLPAPDDNNTFVVELAADTEITLNPLDPNYPQESLKGQTVDSYAIERAKLAKVTEAAIRLGRTKADLIREGVELVLEKYRDKLDDLGTEAPNGDAKPPTGPFSP